MGRGDWRAEWGFVLGAELFIEGRKGCQIRGTAGRQENAHNELFHNEYLDITLLCS